MNRSALEYAAPLLRAMLLTLAALPPLYVFLAIQYSAITVPFWDHAELIRWLDSWSEGSFQYSSLWAPHNHTRPLVYRIVMVFNALLTDWDIRSEYIYVYLALYGTIACHVWALRRITAGAVRGTVLPLAVLLVSLVVFSPVGHNNHWWSMMFQLNAANLFIALGMLLPFVGPQDWRNHVGAAVSCWLATFTLTNGFFAVFALALVFQLSAGRWQRPSARSLFWGINLAALLGCYLPGIAMSSGTAQPTMWQLAEFCLAYLGAPLGGLLWFPFRSMFHVSTSTATNALFGVLLLVSFAALSWHARSRLRQQHPAALILIGFCIFAIVSAIATGWARAAFDESGAAAGNSSRYTIFGAYLLLGQLYYVAAGYAHGWWNNARSLRIAAIGTVVFVCLCVVTYGRAVKVYRDAHRFNMTLSNAYAWGDQATPQDRFIYPNPGFVARLKRDLQRLELGPYNGRAFDREMPPVGEFRKAGLLSGRRKVAQRLTATKAGLKAVIVRLVTPNGRRTAGMVEWQVTEVGADRPLARGTLNAARIKDWEEVRLKLPYLGDSKGREYQLVLSAGAHDAQALGVALYEPASDGDAALIVSEESGASKTESLTMALHMDYTR